VNALHLHVTRALEQEFKVQT